MSTLNTFILFPTSNTTSSIISNNDLITSEKENLDIFLAQLGVLLNQVGSKKGSSVYYNSKEIKAFLEGIQEESKELYAIDPASTIGEYLDNACAINWLDKPFSSNDFQYFIIDFANTAIIELFNHSISEATEHQLVDSSNKIALINHFAINTSNSYVTTLKKSLKPNIAPLLANLAVVHDKNQLEKWLIKNREKRVFNLIQKHGENGKGAYPSNKGEEVSILECSKEEAQLLLDDAIEDVRIDPKRLYNYDTDKGKYIIFYFEGNNPQNQYHGFHISKKDAMMKIPTSILKKLKEKIA